MYDYSLVVNILTVNILKILSITIKKIRSVKLQILLWYDFKWVTLYKPPFVHIFPYAGIPILLVISFLGPQKFLQWYC